MLVEPRGPGDWGTGVARTTAPGTGQGQNSVASCAVRFTASVGDAVSWGLGLTARGGRGGAGSPGRTRGGAVLRM